MVVKKKIAKRIAALKVTVQKRPNFQAAKLMGWTSEFMTKWLYNHRIPLKGLTVERIMEAIKKDGRYPIPPERSEFKEVQAREPDPHARALNTALRNLHDAEGHLQAYYQCLALARDAIAEG